jgi:hypothetical protein
MNGQDDAISLEQAMSAWEQAKASLRRSDAALNGLFIALSSIPGAGIPGSIREARKTSADAGIRATYHHARELVATIIRNENSLPVRMPDPVDPYEKNDVGRIQAWNRSWAQIRRTNDALRAQLQQEIRAIRLAAGLS